MRNRTGRDTGENLRAATSSSPPFSGLRSIGECYPNIMDIHAITHSKIFGDIPAGTMEFIPVTEGLQKEIRVSLGVDFGYHLE